MSIRKAYDVADNIMVLLAQQHRRLSDVIWEQYEKHGYCEEDSAMQRLQHANLLQSLLKDLLESGLYTLQGLERELNVPLELITDLLLKKPCDPSYSLALSILYLHRETFPQLYEQLRKERESIME